MGEKLGFENKRIRCLPRRAATRQTLLEPRGFVQGCTQGLVDGHDLEPMAVGHHRGTQLDSLTDTVSRQLNTLLTKCP